MPTLVSWISQDDRFGTTGRYARESELEGHGTRQPQDIPESVMLAGVGLETTPAASHAEGSAAVYGHATGCAAQRNAPRHSAGAMP